jgi:hypothetical protein
MNTEKIIQLIKPGTKGFVALTVLAFILYAVTRSIEPLATLFAVAFVVMLVIAIVKRPRKSKGTDFEEVTLGGQEEQEFSLSSQSAVVSNDTLVLAKSIQRGIIPFVETPSVFLKEGETAHFQSQAVRYITKNRVIGRTGGGGGLSYRASKNFTLHTGKASSQTIYGDVVGSFPGKLTITNRRIVFAAEQNGFEFSIADLSSVTDGGNGKLVFATPKDQYALHIALSISKKGKAKILSGSASVISSLINHLNSLN